MSFTNPTDVARLGHRFQPFFANSTSAKEIVGHRLQRFEPSIRTNIEIYNELGNLDPVGSATDSPEFRIAFEEFVHNCKLDLLLAGKDPDVDTTWNIANYVQNGVVTAYLLERDNLGVVAGEIELDNCVTSEIQWAWQMGQPITGRYTLEGRVGKRWNAANVIHGSWGAFDTTTPGGIKIKDARLFLGGSTSGYRVYRLQGFTLRVTFRATVVREAGNRALVGTLVEPPQSALDIDLAAADAQPDDSLFTPMPDGGPYTNYDYTQPLELTGSAIRIYDPTLPEANTVLRAWKIEKLRPGDATPILASVRGLATKRYNFVVPRVTTAGSGGVLLYSGDIV